MKMSRDKRNIKTTDWLTRGMTEAELAKAKEKAIKEAETELRNKQIEEMAKDLCHTDTCEIKKIGIPCYHKCKAYKYAERAINKGYRKASEVAREILTDKILIDHLERACGAGGKLALARIKELKKEYEVK